MPYSSFSLAQVKRQFELNVLQGKFFDGIPALSPSGWLGDLLYRSAPFAATLGTEKVRSSLRRRASFGVNLCPTAIRVTGIARWRSLSLENRQIGLLSGTDFSIDMESGLNGVCDFLLTRSPNQLII